MKLYLFSLLSETGLEWARLLHNDPTVLNVLTDPTVVTKEAQRRWFLKLKDSKSSKRVVVEFGGKRVGLVRLDAIDHVNHSIMVGLDVVKEERGKGHGGKILKALLYQLFTKHRFHRADLFVADYNENAHRLYQKLGFREEGRKRKALWRHESYHDYIMMGMLKDEFVRSSMEIPRYAFVLGTAKEIGLLA